MILTIDQLKRLAEADDSYSSREVQDITDTWNALKPAIEALKPIVQLWEQAESATKGDQK